MVHVTTNGGKKKSRRQSDAPGEEGGENKGQTREKNRVESEETQDHEKSKGHGSGEEAEEMSFAPSAISVPRWPLFRCDTQCSEETLSFWQFPSVVIKEDEESYATNLCQKCYNESLKAKGEKH